MRRFLVPEVPILGMEPVAGGFSGDAVIRVETETGNYCLRNWQVAHWPLERIRERHRWLLSLHQHDLPVAVPIRTLTLDVVHSEQDRLWQLEPWLPGASVTSGKLTGPQLQSCMRNLAQLHQVSSTWQSSPGGQEWFQTRWGPAPGIHERRTLIANWTEDRIREARQFLKCASSAGGESLATAEEIRKLLSQILDRFEQSAGMIDRELQRMERVEVPLFPCFRDLWSAHVLFERNDVSGFIDPTAARTEHVAADLSRLLGSYWRDDREGWQRSLLAYEESRPLTTTDRALIRVYDRSSVLLSGMTWLERFQAGAVPVETVHEVTDRLEQLVARSLEINHPSL